MFAAIGTYAAFTATTTNAPNQISSGTVAISDNDTGSAMYNVTDQKPGDVTERCLKVTYTGSLDATAKLYASSVGAFGSHVDLTITPGTTAAGFSGCGTFTPDAKGAIYNGTLKGFADTYTSYTSGLTDYPGSQVKWATNDTVAYRFRLTLRDDFANNDANSVLSAGAHAFTFEVRDGEYANTVRNTSGLVSYWRLGDTSGTTAADSAGTNNGTYTNAPMLNQSGSQTDANPAVDFNGTNQYADVPNNASLQLSTGTVEAWIRTSSAATSFHGIVDKPSAYGLFLHSGYLGTYDYGPPTNRISSAYLADGKWHHVAMTFQNGVASGTKLYADGVLVLTTSTNTQGQSNGVRIGYGDAAPQFFAGRIDEAAVYNRVLTPSEIAAHYNAR